MSTGEKYATGNPVMGYNIPSRGKVVILSLSGFLLQKLKSSAGSVDCLQCACNLTLPYLKRFECCVSRVICVSSGFAVKQEIVNLMLRSPEKLQKQVRAFLIPFPLGSEFNWH